MKRNLSTNVQSVTNKTHAQQEVVGNLANLVLMGMFIY